MKELKFFAEWNSGYEEIVIQFKYGQPIDPDVIEYWQQAIAKFYDDPHAELISQSLEEE